MHGANNIKKSRINLACNKFFFKKECVITLSYSSLFAALASHCHLNKQIRA